MVKLAALAAALVCIGAAAGNAAAAPQKINWSPCFQKLGPFECGTAQVSLDYNDPHGATIAIALTRLPASDPAHRIGSLFLNPGGPGGSGIFEVVFGGPDLFTPEVRARFDLVGFDRAASGTAPRSAASARTSNGRRTSRRSRSRARRTKSRPGSTPTSISTPPARSGRGRSSSACRRPTSCVTSTSSGRRSATRS